MIAEIKQFLGIKKKKRVLYMTESQRLNFAFRLKNIYKIGLKQGIKQLK